MSLSVALTDALTGLFNRRYFDAYLQKMLQTAEVTKKPMGIVYMDIDFFKKVNDTYGHTVGDEILQGFAARVKDSLRSFDLVARLGGEEFVAILPDTTEDVAQIIAERLRRTVAEKPFPVSSPEGKLSVTCSFGGVVIQGEGASVLNIQDVLKRADDQLYQAKNGGRNCVYFEGKGRLEQTPVAERSLPPSE